MKKLKRLTALVMSCMLMVVGVHAQQPQSDPSVAIITFDHSKYGCALGVGDLDWVCSEKSRLLQWDQNTTIGGKPGPVVRCVFIQDNRNGAWIDSEARPYCYGLNGRAHLKGKGVIRR